MREWGADGHCISIHSLHVSSLVIMGRLFGALDHSNCAGHDMLTVQCLGWYMGCLHQAAD